MNELITACLDAGNASPLANFPIELLDKGERTILNWIAKFFAHHKTLPSAERVQMKFSEFVPMRAEYPGPLEDLYDRTLESRIKEHVITKMSDGLTELMATGEFDISIPTDLMRLAHLKGGLDKYSTFDRSEYFRSGARADLDLPLINKAMGGVRSGEFALVVGRLGSGKTTLATWFCHKWREQGKTVLFIPNESRSVEVFARLDAMSGGFNTVHLRGEEPEETIKFLVEQAARRAKEDKGEVLIPHRRLKNPSQVLALAESISVDAIIIDGIYLMSPSERSYASKWENVASVSNEIKQIALDIDAPILGVSQLKRVGNKSVLDMEDIAYSDTLGQDADFVLMMESDVADHKRVTVSMKKNRFGPEAAEIIYYDFDHMRIVKESTEGREPDGSPREGFLW